MVNRGQVIDQNFIQFCKDGVQREAPVQGRRPLHDPYKPELELTGETLRELFRSQMISRHLDLMARQLRKEERGYYTIGSSGHEGNVVLGRLVRRTDPAFLHYRSGALMVERARQVSGSSIIHDTVLGLMGSKLDPIAGGRHKVFGSVAMWVPPQTSTIASHLPKAVGAAIAFVKTKRLGLKPNSALDAPLPKDSIILCTFGDATINHTVATGAFNTASWSSHLGLRTPILFVCEDNGLGISVPSPRGWVAAALQNRPGIAYYEADGRNLAKAYETARRAVDYVRTQRRPAFLHMRTVRLMGHAGSDVETTYRSLEEIRETEADDPLLHSARVLVRAGYMDGNEILAMYEEVREEVATAAHELRSAPLLTERDEVLAPLAPFSGDAVAAEATRAAPAQRRLEAFDCEAQFPERQSPKHMAVNINRALADLLAKYPELMIFGEDVGKKGGVYNLTGGLAAKFGVIRVFDTVLDETTILGLALGAAQMGLLPMPEIQYLAYLHNAIDQLRSEACSTQFFSSGQFRNPMVIRIAALAYQKGFGGHFHNDNSIAALRDIPGLIVAVPSRGDDAAGMLRTATALARVDGRVVAFLEPIALYMTRDLHEPGDGAWQFAYPEPTEAVPFGSPRVYQPDANDLVVFTYGNGVWMSLRAARDIERAHGVRVRIVDLRWLSPLNEDAIASHANATARVLIVDEGRRSGGIAEGIMALLLERGKHGQRVRRVCGADSYIPLGPAANLVLPTEADIVAAAADLLAN